MTRIVTSSTRHPWEEHCCTHTLEVGLTLSTPPTPDFAFGTSPTTTPTLPRFAILAHHLSYYPHFRRTCILLLYVSPIYIRPTLGKFAIFSTQPTLNSGRFLILAHTPTPTLDRLTLFYHIIYLLLRTTPTVYVGGEGDV